MDEEWEGGDPTKGAKLYKLQCAKCHTIGMDTLNKVGPTLWNIFGSRSGSNRTYRYSKALAHANIEWTGPTLYAFLEDPKSFLPGFILVIQVVKWHILA